MTYPGFTYPPLTPLFPSHEYVEQYHVDYANYHNVSQYIRTHHKVVAAEWIGDGEKGEWELEVHVQDQRAKDGPIGIPPSLHRATIPHVYPLFPRALRM